MDDEVLDQLIAREPLFHRPEFGTTRADFDAMISEDYWEVGASGNRYEPEFLWSVLARRYAESAPDEWRTSDFACRRLGPDTFLLTYVLEQGERRTRRATIWERTPAGWRALYHQGTLVSG